MTTTDIEQAREYDLDVVVVGDGSDGNLWGVRAGVIEYLPEEFVDQGSRGADIGS